MMQAATVVQAHKMHGLPVGQQVARDFRFPSEL
jgi:hypothetical protein